MKKALFPILLALAAAGVTYVVTTWTVTEEAESRARYEAGLGELHVTYMTNNAVLRPILDLQQRPDLQKYLNEVNNLASWYFKEQAKKFWDKHPGKYDSDSIIKEHRRLAEEEGSRQKSAKSNLPIREECYELVKAAYDDLKGGSYKPVASSFQGSVRFDAYKLKKEGNKLYLPFGAWGGIGDLVFDGWHIRWFKTPTEQEVADFEKGVKRAKRRREEPEMQDPRGQHFAEAASASKSPVLPMFKGEEYIADFPAGATINYFVTPACPPNAEDLEVKFKLKARAMSGDDQLMEFVFKMPVNSAWKGSWEGVRTIEAVESY
jgi:hypothetical protein